jgi:hypothetical protein
MRIQNTMQICVEHSRWRREKGKQDRRSRDHGNREIRHGESVNDQERILIWYHEIWRKRSRQARLLLPTLPDIMMVSVFVYSNVLHSLYLSSTITPFPIGHTTQLHRFRCVYMFLNKLSKILNQWCLKKIFWKKNPFQLYYQIYNNTSPVTFSVSFISYFLPLSRKKKIGGRIWS